MLSKSQISLINALSQKKFRKHHQLFVVEGVKSVLEFIHSSYEIDGIIGTADALTKLDKNLRNIKYQEVSQNDFSRLTQLKSPQGVLALVKIPQVKEPLYDPSIPKHRLILDNIQDPGNLGTIIRTADWFGFNEIVCSEETVDVYNPKVVQATMGSLSRVSVLYTNIESLLSSSKIASFGALFDGQSIYKTDFGDQGWIVLGNEGNGISEAVRNEIDTAVTIPSFGQAESLNVAIAATVFCSEIARKRF